MKELLQQFLGKELCIDRSIGLQNLLDYHSRYELLKIEKSSEVFRVLKSASELITIHSNGVQEITDFSKLNLVVPNESIISLDVNGFMSSEDGWCNYGAKSFAKALLAYKNIGNVIGAKINFDSGGGEVMAGHIIFDAIKEFKKPVIGFVYNAGSAAYLAASACKEIVAANENSRVGSIGAYISISKKFLEAYSSDVMDIYSSMSTDKNSDFNDLLKGDDSKIIAKLDKSVEIFHSKVKNNRILKRDPEGSLKGGMFFADEAKKRGLIDSIGSQEFALSRVKSYIK
ncbi:MAG: S49 family peptidase [Saprospiraceae bacterium]